MTVDIDIAVLELKHLYAAIRGQDLGSKKLINVRCRHHEERLGWDTRMFCVKYEYRD